MNRFERFYILQEAELLERLTARKGSTFRATERFYTTEDGVDVKIRFTPEGAIFTARIPKGRVAFDVNQMAADLFGNNFSREADEEKDGWNYFRFTGPRPHAVKMT